MKHSIERSTLRKTLRRGATGMALAAAVGASTPALAAGNANNTYESGGAAAPTQKDRQRNAKAQAQMDRLARRIVNGAVHKESKGGDQLITERDGTKLVDRTVIVPASNIFSDEPGEYQFNVLSRLKKNGQPLLKNVLQVQLSQGAEGTGKTADVMTNQYASLNFVREGSAGSVHFLGDYLSPKGPERTIIEAGAILDVPHEAHLTADRLQASVAQADTIIDDAIEMQPIGTLAPAFKQPAHSVVDLLK